MGDVEVIFVRFGQSTIFVFIMMCSTLMPSSSRMGGSSGSPSPRSVDEMLRTMPLREVSTAEGFDIDGARRPCDHSCGPRAA